MTPVYQTDLTPTHGNCFSACLASVLDLPIEQVPNFYDIAPHENGPWWDAVRAWLKPLGWSVIHLTLDPAHLGEFPGVFIVGGKTSRHTDHAVVYQDGHLVHDPFPGGVGLVRVDTVDLLYPLDPARMRMVPTCSESQTDRHV